MQKLQWLGEDLGLVAAALVADAGRTARGISPSEGLGSPGRKFEAFQFAGASLWSALRRDPPTLRLRDAETGSSHIHPGPTVFRCFEPPLPWGILRRMIFLSSSVDAGRRAAAVRAPLSRKSHTHSLIERAQPFTPYRQTSSPAIETR